MPVRKAALCALFPPLFRIVHAETTIESEVISDEFIVRQNVEIVHEH